MFRVIGPRVEERSVGFAEFRRRGLAGVFWRSRGKSRGDQEGFGTGFRVYGLGFRVSQTLNFGNYPIQTSQS